MTLPLAQRDRGLHIHLDPSTDERRYNAPTTSHEIAALIPGDGSNFDSARDIILRYRAIPAQDGVPADAGLRRISEHNAAYTPLHYVFLFPFGELGWHPNIPYANAADPEDAYDDDHEPDAPAGAYTRVTQARYHAYRLFSRVLHDDEGNDVQEPATILLSG